MILVFNKDMKIIIENFISDTFVANCINPNLNRMLNFYGIKIHQVIECFLVSLSHWLTRAYKWDVLKSNQQLYRCLQ